MKTLLISHKDADLNRKGIVRWLTSFSNLVGVILLQETRARLWRRFWQEVNRVGIFRFSDVVAFRKQLCNPYPEIGSSTAIQYTHSPNTPEAEEFIKKLSPDIILACCKILLKEAIFSIPSPGTFIMHPEYALNIEVRMGASGP